MLAFVLFDGTHPPENLIAPLDFSIGRGSLLVIPSQAAGWDDPEELIRSQGFRLSVDPKSQVAVFFADAERTNLLQAGGGGRCLPTFCRQPV